MGSIKIIAVAFAISFGIIIFVTSERLRTEIINILTYKLGKTNIKICQQIRYTMCSKKKIAVQVMKDVRQELLHSGNAFF